MSKGGGSDVETPDLEDYLPLIQASADVNRVNQTTPYGSVKYNTTYKDPLKFKKWLKQQGGRGAFDSQPEQSYNIFSGSFGGGPNQVSGNGSQATGSSGNPRDAYQDYVNEFDRGTGKTTARHTFSPEIQSLFDKQFDPDSYQNYSDDYMSRYSELIQPDRDYAVDRFEQNMFDRGQPVGGEEYGDKYRQTIGDPFARQDVMAAQGAAQAADVARLQDYNRLATAMGMSTVPVPQIDTMGAANMAMNANVANAQNSQQSESDFWNSLGMLGAGWASGGFPGIG